MIKSIRLQNFFGFQDCTINLEKGENVLVGINGSGKSNFFRAIRLLNALVKGRGLRDTIFEEFHGFERILFNGNIRIPITVIVELDTIDMFEVDGFGLFYELKFYVHSNKLDYSLTEKVWRVEHGVSDEPEFSRTKNQIFLLGNSTIDNKKLSVLDPTESELWRYKDYLPELSDVIEILEKTYAYDNFDLAKIKNGTSPRIENHLLIDGTNLASLINDLKIKNKSAYKNIVKSLKKINPNYIEIHTKQMTSILELWIEETVLESSIPATNISDGTLRFLCLMAILYNPNRGSVICIDEPELGLHPDMLHTLSEAIKYAAETSQIIISTHSPQLLDWFEFKNVRVFEKNENNATIVKELDEKKFEGWYDKYLLGDMWMKGDIGGNRW